MRRDEKRERKRERERERARKKTKPSCLTTHPFYTLYSEPRTIP